MTACAAEVRRRPNLRSALFFIATKSRCQARTPAAQAKNAGAIELPPATTHALLAYYPIERRRNEMLHSMCGNESLGTDAIRGQKRLQIRDDGIA